MKMKFLVIFLVITASKYAPLHILKSSYFHYSNAEICLEKSCGMSMFMSLNFSEFPASLVF